MTLGERMRKLRRTLELTQQEFANRIGSVQNSITGYESGRRNPSAPVIALICREFGVREEWLRTGAGEMFEPEATNVLDALVKERGINSNERILIEKFLNLKPESRQAVMDYLLDVAAAISGTAKSTDDSGTVYIPEPLSDEYSVAADIDIDSEVAKYRAELERQKKAVADSSASNGSEHAG